MADRKNQHFVPRCLLKPFTLKREGHAINTYILGAGRHIPNAPAKGQCAKTYFYGEDLKAETALSGLEGRFARILSMLEKGCQLSPSDDDWLRLFTVLQTRRTEKAVAETAKATEDLMDTIYRKHPEQRPESLTRKQLIALSMSGGLAMHDYSGDLKFIVLRNKTTVDFILSDNPAVMTNRWAFERLKDDSFGMSNSGLILALPLTPHLLAYFFDIGIYTVSIPRGTNFVDITSSADIEALNHLQCLSAHKNLYFSNWDQRDYITGLAVAATPKRESDTHRITELIRDQSVTGPHEAFRKGSEEEKAQSQQFLVMNSFVHPEPSAWPGILKYRPKPVSFNNGSSVGYVRKKEWLTRRAKVSAGHR
ncbi:DUF4238 domain-containing protein [Bradyrhizobium sp. 27S5]|uniref:DUF4238 domain-containing protein n=1 Tax=Bradyrhizobium sp. 27S5 TaxID=3139728 RepID=UPI0030D26445